MTTESITSELLPNNSFDQYVLPRGIWEVVRSFFQALQTAVDLSAEMQFLDAEEQVVVAGRYSEGQVP